MQFPRIHAVLVGAMLFACGGGSGGDGPGTGESESVSPNDPNALSQVITIPGAVRVQGQPPSSTGDGPTIDSTSGSSLSVDSGGQARLDIAYQGASAYTNCLVQVEGANDYFDIEVTDPIAEGEIQIPVDIPSSVDTGSFSLYTCVVDSSGGVSNPLSTGVSVTSTFSDDTSSSGTSNGTNTGDDICSGQQLTSECTLEYCMSQDGNDCYYVVDGGRITCPGCDTTSCAQEAANACLN